MRSTLTALTVALLAALPLAAFAQSLEGLSSLQNTNPFTLSATPAYPAPYGTAMVSALSSTLDLTNAIMDISVAGKSIYQGSVRSVAVQLGAAGTPITANVTITANGTPYTQSITIRPEDVALVAEPRATAPPLYPGEPEEPLNGNVRVVAVASFRDDNGAAIDPTTLSYAWTVDGTLQSDYSGIGKSAIIVVTPLQYRQRDVSVVVQSQDGTLAGGGSLTLSPQEPTVRLYQLDPLLGILYDHAISNSYTIVGAESTLYAGLFSFPTMNNTPIVNWYLNGTAAQTGGQITLRPTGSGQGSASLSLTAATDATAQVTANLSLIFGAAQSTNFFGL